jgi:hypothetical protein
MAFAGVKKLRTDIGVLGGGEEEFVIATMIDGV